MESVPRVNPGVSRNSDSTRLWMMVRPFSTRLAPPKRELVKSEMPRLRSSSVYLDMSPAIALMLASCRPWSALDGLMRVRKSAISESLRAAVRME